MTPQQVLDEWFGELTADGEASDAKRQRWFIKDPGFDQHLRDHYRATVDAAAAGELDWGDSIEARLAEIILLDQFSRNIYRGSGEMYKGDERALALSKEMVRSDQDEQLPAAKRAFVYMPLMHSENLEDQDECVACFTRHLQTCSDAIKKGAEQSLQYAKMHRDIVARFGRFPHRNDLLGRETTAEETEFLQQPGSSF